MYKGVPGMGTYPDIDKGLKISKNGTFETLNTGKWELKSFN